MMKRTTLVLVLMAVIFPAHAQGTEDQGECEIATGLGLSGVAVGKSLAFYGFKTSLELHVNDSFSIGLSGSFEFHPLESDRYRLLSIVGPRFGMIFNIGDYSYLKPYVSFGLIRIDLMGSYDGDADDVRGIFAGLGVVACYMLGEVFGLSADFSFNLLLPSIILTELQLGVVFAF
jgi:hypothetical protein